MGMDKVGLRKSVRSKLSTLTVREKQRQALLVMEAVKEHPAIVGAEVIAAFSPLPDELQIWDLVEELSQSKVIALPRIEADGVMQFYRYCKESLASGSYGIMEPSATTLVTPGEIDAMIVPGVVFTVSGARMGRGKGYYDKYMSQTTFRAFKLGVCYEEQLVDELPMEPHDVVMDVVVHA